MLYNCREKKGEKEKILFFISSIDLANQAQPIQFIKLYLFHSSLFILRLLEIWFYLSVSLLFPTRVSLQRKLDFGIERKRDSKSWYGNFTFPLPFEFSLSLSPSFEENWREMPRATAHMSVCVLSTYLRIYRVSQIKRSFAKRPSRPISSELIIATSAYQRPRDSDSSTQTPLFFTCSQSLRKGCAV